MGDCFSDDRRSAVIRHLWSSLRLRYDVRETVPCSTAPPTAAAPRGFGADHDCRGSSTPPPTHTHTNYKLEFATYDGTTDPLNWLNQCEQFFRGKRTLASDRTWLASYHLKGAAQTWYYALEQDEGMPPWDRFKALCNLQFGSAVHNSRLSELARLPFLSTMQDYAERFNAVLCHSHNLSAAQKAELFCGWSTETQQGGRRATRTADPTDGEVLD